MCKCFCRIKEFKLCKLIKRNGNVIGVIKEVNFFQKHHSLSNEQQIQEVSDTTHADTDSDLSSVHVGLGPHDVLMDEARRFRQNQELTKAQLDKRFQSLILLMKLHVILLMVLYSNYHRM